jgi:hypothetical protein
MRNFLGVVLLLSVGASPLGAKGETARIVVEGADLPKPFDITDPKILANFNVWAGPGTSSDSTGFNPNTPSFVIDWVQGPVAEIPTGLQRYKVSFYVKSENEKLAYVVFSANDFTTKHGYVYLPGNPTRTIGATWALSFVGSKESGFTLGTCGKT